MKLKLFRKKEGGVPDVGREEDPEEKKKKNSGVFEPEELEQEPEEERDEAPQTVTRKNENSRPNSSFEIEKLSAKLGSLDGLVRGYGERISVLNQQIGELRSMNLTNEKSISKIAMDSSKAVDIVKEVKPEILRMDYQRALAKAEELAERIETNKQFMDTILNELKDLRRKVGTFVGTDALLRLSEDVKKDLVETQRLLAKTRLHADKSEQIFIELKNSFMESRKVSEMVNNLDTNYSGVQKDVEKLKLDFSKVVNSNDFNDFQKSVNNKFSIVENAMLELTKISEENERLGRMIETILSLEEKNKNDIADMAMAIGDDHIKRVSDYNDRLISIVEIVDSLAGQMLEVKKAVGMESEKKIDMTGDKSIMKKGRLEMKNLKVHPHVSRKLTPSKPNVPDTIQKIQDYARPSKQMRKMKSKASSQPIDRKSFEEKIMDLRMEQSREERSPYDILGEKVAEKIKQAVVKEDPVVREKKKVAVKKPSGPKVQKNDIPQQEEMASRLENIRDRIKMLSADTKTETQKRRKK